MNLLFLLIVAYECAINVKYRMKLYRQSWMFPLFHSFCAQTTQNERILKNFRARCLFLFPSDHMFHLRIYLTDLGKI